ncbi:RecT family recombinase [Sinorhizobium meliloti]|uniref:RecT family recombinase n=2 Tax=Rhizobium meliloti TaxID=382 RepID=UPI00030941B6|nr:RecT family recombinase [Sinorhizobium meliloti]MDE3768606.1 recombinase RecT [Sinorhizobium meliloti]MDE3781885.1 recombinase RecT [Sinorhizobium meliloti]MDE3806385.1 recombinase RecT [Sinorhizobium meliloti]RVI19372.1 recombinase [Sinorhizobium meliloti]RVO65629.1 recombinase [Sinorhizobium meliloti]
MNQLAKAPRRSVLIDMAGQFGMEADAFEMTVRAQCSPTPKKGEQFRPLTREEFAAFLLVAKKYDLNPLTREIFAYPKRGGGVVPIVSIDGWINLVNSHPACDGFEFTWERDANGDPISCTCIMHRKDRSHPTAVTEYLAECWRDTDPWKMKNRMLRHKALMQCARYAFGFAGIYDEDEGRRIAEDQNIALLPPAPRAPRIGQQSPAGEKIQTAQGDATEVESGTGQPPVDSASPLDDEPDPDREEMGGVDADAIPDAEFFDELRDRLAEAKDAASVEEVWTELDPMARFEGSDLDQEICQKIKARRLREMEKEDPK